MAIQITLNAGRSIDDKQKIYQSIAKGLSGARGVQPEDVFISLMDVPKENWLFANGTAQYVEKGS